MLKSRPTLFASLETRVVAAAALAVLWLGTGTALALLFSGRIRDWSVMTDELLYAKLATSIAETGSPLPSVHGTSIAVYNQLYPLLIAPLYGALGPPDAFRAAHVLNAFLMASAAIPAYLLARQVLERGWSLGVALLSVLVPWMVLTGFLMTGVAAYPAFLWAMLGLQLAIADPRPRRDLLAVAALALAVLARTQFAALVVVLPLAILGHEAGQALLSAGSRRQRLVAGARASFQKHRLLAAVYTLGVAGAAVVAVVDSAGGVLGVYAVTVEEGSLLPSGVWSTAARHVDAVGIGCGLAPLVLGGGWMLATVVRPRSRREHALATLSLLTVVVLTFEVASFAVRFGTDDVRDRYLFYVVPILLMGSAAALAAAERRRQIAAGAALVTIFFAFTAASLPFKTFTGIWVDSPASVLNDLLIEQSGDLGTGTFVALLGFFVGLVLVLGVLLAPRTPLALVVFAALLVFSVLTLGSEVDRVRSGTGLTGRPLTGPPGLVLDWVDTVVPDGEEAAIIAFPVSTAWDTTAIRWWDAEFWNRSVTHAYVAGDENFAYTPFPHRVLDIDWSSGEVPDTFAAPPYVVAAPDDPRFLLAGRPQAANLGFVVRGVARPYRAVWATRGLQADGWTTPGRTATVRVYGRSENRTDLARVRITLRAPSSAPSTYRISAVHEVRAGRLSPEAGTVEELVVCLLPGVATDLTITSSSTARIEGVQLSPDVGATRAVGVGLGPISVQPLRDEC